MLSSAQMKSVAKQISTALQTSLDFLHWRQNPLRDNGLTRVHSIGAHEAYISIIPHLLVMSTFHNVSIVSFTKRRERERKIPLMTVAMKYYQMYWSHVGHFMQYLSSRKTLTAGCPLTGAELPVYPGAILVLQTRRCYLNSESLKLSSVTALSRN